MSREARIIEVVQMAAAHFGVFNSTGPGRGNKVTNSAISHVNEIISAEFGADVVQQRLSTGHRQSVDFLLLPERTVIEVEFSLSNPYPCLEKDVFKVLLGREHGFDVERLVLVGDPGCQRRLSAPAPQAVIAWVAKHHNLRVAVVELGAS